MKPTINFDTGRFEGWTVSFEIDASNGDVRMFTYNLMKIPNFWHTVSAKKRGWWHCSLSANLLASLGEFAEVETCTFDILFPQCAIITLKFMQTAVCYWLSLGHNCFDVRFHLNIILTEFLKFELLNLKNSYLTRDSFCVRVTATKVSNLQICVKK